jgi:hypothetical protein
MQQPNREKMKGGKWVHDKRSYRSQQR